MITWDTIKWQLLACSEIFIIHDDIEFCLQEKTKLDAQLVAQESMIHGLKAERKLWGEELAQQGKGEGWGAGSAG